MSDQNNYGDNEMSYENFGPVAALLAHALEVASRVAKPGETGETTVKRAREYHDFLSEGLTTEPSSVSAPSGAKSSKADAPSGDTDAAEPSSGKSAAGAKKDTKKPSQEKASTSTNTSPSEGNGFDKDGNEITLDVIRTAAVKFTAAHGEKPFIEKLGEFGSGNLSGLEPARYAELLEFFEGYSQGEAEDAGEEDPFD